MSTAKKVLRLPASKLPRSRAEKDRARFRALSTVGVTFGPCTMPPWAGTSGFSEEDIAELDAMFTDGEDESKPIQLPLFDL
jgi:hypothetical protein